MKYLVKWLAAAALLLPLGASAQITGSFHDLSATNAAVPVRATTETAICIFCHTPHVALAQALIWNRRDPVGARGWAAGTITADGTALPADISASSRRCLSCHDATIALGDVNNQGVNAAYAPGIIAMTQPNPRAEYLVGNGPAGDEMVNNHPVSVPYAGETYLGIVSGATTVGPGTYFPLVVAGCTSPSGICTNGPGGAAIEIKVDGVGGRGIECSSCHEVHNQFGLNPFLRVSRDASAICFACHNK